MIMNFFSKIFLFLFLFAFSFINVFAAVDRFNVELNFESAQVGEALDITISAVDRNGQIVKEYLWDILVFSESDPAAEFPDTLSDNSYKFIPANEGTVKFENAVVFRKTGTQNIYVYDLNQETVMGLVEVEITEAATTRVEEIEILSPENGVTLGRDTLTLSGQTQKNHQVNIKVNSLRDIPTTSNDDGIFEIAIENLNQWENSFQAQVLDANSVVIGESSIIRIQVNSLAPEFRAITINPTWEVAAESEISIEVISNSWLRQVDVIINDVITKLTEIRDGRYTGKSFAPVNAWTYPIDVVLRNEFNIETREANAAQLQVKAKVELEAAPEAERIIEEIGIAGAPQERADDMNLSIRNIRVTELKERSIITWDVVPEAESYNIYKKINERQVELIANVKENRFEIDIIWDELKYEEFAIKALGRTQTGTLVQWDLSDMTRVQTGPTLYFILLLLALLLSGWVFYIKSRKVA